ncbi:hypothetical protein F5148DRAFT_1152050 [Russula earlei]|uniref:Uncharacterized protein n=1 Tax=Russula earlei TaxID=71964 RepID=A0ACC0TYH9_9AGAM|nr:hypothetical protein F5148DRAFT_1152050 [Russula earlei]
MLQEKVRIEQGGVQRARLQTAHSATITVAQSELSAATLSSSPPSQGLLCHSPMATDFWASSHNGSCHAQASTEQGLQYVKSTDHINFLNIYSANFIVMLGKPLMLHQWFYIKNLYCKMDPFMVIAMCCYVATKAVESPVHIKNIVSESHLMFGYT